MMKNTSKNIIIVIMICILAAVVPGISAKAAEEQSKIQDRDYYSTYDNGIEIANIKGNKNGKAYTVRGYYNTNFKLNIKYRGRSVSPSQFSFSSSNKAAVEIDANGILSFKNTSTTKGKWGNVASRTAVITIKKKNSGDTIKFKATTIRGYRFYKVRMTGSYRKYNNAISDQSGTEIVEQKAYENKSYQIINVRGTTKLKVRVLSGNLILDVNKGVTWTSSDKSVATVSNKGVVTPKKNGYVTVYAKAKGSKKGICAAFRLNVTKLDNKSYGKMSSPLYKESGDKLETSFKSKGDITWESMDTSIATVSNKGVVTFKKSGIGMAVIIVAKCGSEQNTFTVKCCNHSWVKGHYGNVCVQAAYDEEITESHGFCGRCHADLTPWNHDIGMHCLEVHPNDLDDHGNRIEWNYYIANVVVGTIHHDAVYARQWVAGAASGNGTTVYRCSKCGAIK